MITKRQNEILKVIVEEYIRTAKPVSSNHICKKLKCSSATIRNEMVALEELHLLEKNHFASGRIPSEEGYKYYVDNLMKPKNMTGEDMLKLQTIFRNNTLDLNDTIKKSIEIISEITNYTAVVLGGASKENRLKKVEVVPLEDNKILSIVITDKGVVQHKTLYLPNTVPKEDVKKTVYLYGLTKLLYSLLVVADYYATTEFMNGARMLDFGEIVDYEDMIDIYESGDVQKKIREYEKETYPMEKEKLEKIDEINILRTEMFLDAERVLKQNSDQTFYYLEAPTGSGKSNTAMNLGFRLIRENEKLNKIFYIYPFNTLVEQNMESIGKIFGENERVMSQVAVVNSLVPMKDRDEGNDWNRILLDRQFLNYPIVLSTHVMLFRTMFGHAKEDVFGFHQLSHSVIILDEIQSYKNELWGEIITFLKGFAELMQMKIIIMSATLPNLDILTDNHCQTIRLIENREKYFNHPKFARRVVADYSLLEQKMTMEYLTDEIVKKAGKNKKVLIEFIRKRSAEECYRILCEKSEIPVFLMTGDSSILDRKRMIRKIEALDSVILVATQVVEAGVDIDMDIGYKDISRLDSEEQFMGRINRSGRKSGIVYFFDLDNAEKIYSGDKRIEKDKTLVNKEMRELLTAKNFPAYYENGILPLVLAEKKKCNDENIEDFFQKTVGNLDMPKVDKRMQLINDNRLMKSVYLGRIIQEENGEELDGRFVWDEYKQLIEETEMEYSERKVKLHNVRSKMNAFIYQFSCKAEFMEDEQIGELYYIENGEAYFDENDILRRELFEEGKDLFI